MASKPPTPAGPTYRLTREDWLHRAAEILGGMVHQVSGMELPEFHVSMGFGGTSYEKGVRGVCWKRCVSDDGRNHVFISPELKDTGVVLAVLLHEILHVVLDCEDGTEPRKDGSRTSHRGQFAEFATRLGLCAPFTSAIPDIELTAALMTIAAELGDFPHSGLNVPSHARKPGGILVPIGGGGGTVSSAPKPQTNRWISFACPVHDVPVRMSRGKAAHGAPFCGHRSEDDGVACLMEMKER
jgi:hypothetical protein